MNNDFRSWVIAGTPSDFNHVTINRQHVVMTQRIKHDENGVDVTLIGQPQPLTLTASFAKFDAWLKGELDT